MPTTDIVTNTLAPEAIVSLWVAALNGRDLNPLRYFCREDVTVHAAAAGDDDAIGLGRIGPLLDAYGAAFPEGQFTVEEIRHEGDLIACTWAARGVNSGPFLHFAPTGREITLRGRCRFRFVDGLVTEHWFDFNLHDMLEQLGALLPAPGYVDASSLALSEQAMNAWTDALTGRSIWFDDLFSDELVLYAYCFRLRTTDIGRGALTKTLAFVQATLSGIEVAIDHRVGQGTTTTYRGTISGWSSASNTREAFGLDCIFRTEGAVVSECWVRIGRAM